MFNNGDYLQAVRSQAFAENISKVLYPEDSTPQGKELRLQQQYFFVACSLRDYIDNTLPRGFDLHRLHGTGDLPAQRHPPGDRHPGADAHPGRRERLRLGRGVGHLPASASPTPATPCCRRHWRSGRSSLLGRLLPRHLEIIYRINEEFLVELREAYPTDELRVRRMSIIQEHPERAIRMAYLATVGGSKVNGVAELHSQLLRDKVLSDFSAHWPEKFTNVTNGVTPRRFIALANPGLTGLITDTIGDGWLSDLERLQELEPYAEDDSFLDAFAAIKVANKVPAGNPSAGAGRHRAGSRTPCST